MSDTIYLVHATVGEYSDQTEWIVAWYDSEAAAKAHAEAAKAETATVIAKIKEIGEDYWSDVGMALMRTKLDPFRELYCGDGPTYSVFAVERGKWPFPLPEGKS